MNPEAQNPAPPAQTAPDPHAFPAPLDVPEFLLPHLSANTRLLDAGCGQAALTMNLAEHITQLGGAPAQVTGVDQSADAIAEATELAAEKSLDVPFQRADIHQLPFADATFDVVFCHQVLHHVADPQVVLQEFRRVTKPGGIIAVRDADFGAMTWFPPNPGLSRWRATFSVGLATHDGNPAMGRQVPHTFYSAGLTDLSVSGSLTAYASEAEREALAEKWTRRSMSPHSARTTAAALGEDFPDTAVTDDGELVPSELGTVTREALTQITEGWSQWAATGGAAFFIPNTEVIARVP